MKTVADFKRAMVVGSKWETIHAYTGLNKSEPRSLGVRTVGKVRVKDFAFRTDKGTLSWCDWPKNSEFSTECNGKVAVIKKPDFVTLKYKMIEIPRDYIIMHVGMDQNAHFEKVNATKNELSKLITFIEERGGQQVTVNADNDEESLVYECGQFI